MKKKSQPRKPNKIQALKVNQWLKGWDSVQWSNNEHRREPQNHFYVFSLSARQLQVLSGVYRRSLASRTGLQRAHEPSRSEKIAKYIKYGYPWSDLTDSQRKEKRFDDLQKPGWLPTAIVVNILAAKDTRDGERVDPNDLVTVRDLAGNIAEVQLPASFNNSNTWQAKQRLPIEIIDGQHRLLAFEDKSIAEDYELPVVAFYGLDISWQAYLFWTINIKPKRINPSLAFDLYPLLRTEDWLERFEGHKVYRETRAQELVEILWSEKDSAWYDRINMLGESGGPSVTQAAWVRALLKTYVKSFEGRGISIGGLFGAPVGQDKIAIPWNKSQQAALLIYLWNELRDAVRKSKAKWALELRDAKKQEYKKAVSGDPAFVGPYTMLNNDQGISVVLNVTNDLLFINREKLRLQEWNPNAESSSASELKDLKKKKILADFVFKLAKELSKFDWRSSAAKGLSEDDLVLKLSYRGGSGYKQFRRQLLKHLFISKDFGSLARETYKILGFAKEDAKNAR
ncbi:MAG: DGQHR domain-containing protein [Candidatus Sungbacteria bacterium]|nr:DGQHR domain-containing protein [Candidatus Sungbacteria bacterium]